MRRIFDHGIESDTIHRTKLKEWVRPSDWLTLPTVLETDQKFVGLHAVFPKSNFLALSAAGNYTVDWGDGTVENYNANVVAYHEYNYATYDTGNATLCSRGYKQAIVTITPQAGQDLTALDLHQKHNKTNLQKYCSGFLDIALASNKLVSLNIASINQGYSAATLYFNLLERVDIARSKLRKARSLFLGCKRLAKIERLAFSNREMEYITPLIASNVFTLANHQFENGELIIFTSTKSGIVTFNPYFIVNGTTDTFQISTTPTGAAMTGIANGTVDARIGTNLQNAFNACSSLKTVPLFDTSDVISMHGTFSTCYALEIVPKLNLSEVLITQAMFATCSSLREVPLFDTGEVRNMSNMFQDCVGLTKVPDLDTTNVTTMYQMFLNAYSLEKLTFSKTDNLVNAEQICSGCTALAYFKLVNNPKVQTFMFALKDCKALTECYIGYNTTLYYVDQMFSGCFSLQEAPNFSMPYVASIGSMFTNCVSLKLVPAYSMPNCTNLSGMFAYCGALTTVPVFTTGIVTNVNSMFSNCYALVEVPAFDFSSVASGNFSNMLTNCANLTSFKATGVKYTISFTGCKLSTDALDEIYTNLGTGSGQTITVSNNHGNNADNTSIATAKGWTVTG